MRPIRRLKRMPFGSDYLHCVLEQLAGAGPISSRRMFGSVGLYRDEVFFAIVSRDVVYFKVGDANRADYETRGAAQFRAFPDKPRLSMSYYEVPADILEDAEQCAAWARRAVAAAASAKKPESPNRKLTGKPRRESPGRRTTRPARP